MSLTSELAAEIWAESGFHADFDALEAANIRTELREGELLEAPGDVEPDLLKRLMQAALIFADTEDDALRDTAQRISTAALRLGGSTVSDLFSLIQGRLRNFAALGTRDGGALPPVHAPMSLQYEFVAKRTQQTVVAGDDSEHVLTPFQLETWKTLRSGRSTALSGPTSASKSYVLLLHLVEQFRSGRASAAAYGVPTRALINQVSDDAAAALTSRGVRGVTVTSVPVDLSSDDASKTLYVVTQERLDALLIGSPKLHLDLVIVDEAQMLADGSRGVLLESVMDRLNKGKSQFVFSGPLIDNPEYFGSLFGIEAFASCVSNRSPVTQKLVFLDYVDQPKSRVTVKTRSDGDFEAIATIELPIRLLTDADRLSYLSYTFGRSGSSIVYAGGKAEAEKIATKIATEIPPDEKRSESLSELIGFVKKHIHKDYALVSTLEKGVGFHYGHMPSLLRKQLEDHFREKKLQYLVCTSTLLYGLNLPARNIFLSKPTTGRGTPISGPAFWNLSGRAGRLGKELEGNVYLIDYGSWESQPLSQARSVSVTSALKATLVDQAADLISFLHDPTISSDAKPDLEIASGKLVLDHRTNRLDQTLRRYAPSADPRLLEEIRDRVAQISAMVEIPTEVLNSNIGVSIFRQKDLLDYFVKRLKQLPPEQLIPAHPLGEFGEVLANHRRAFKRIHTYLLKYASGDRRHNFFSPLALRWMRGDPLPVLINGAISYNQNNNTGKSVASIIRDTMEDVEQDLRFRYVKYFTCYNGLLSVALEQTGKADYIPSIPNIPLFLEVGGSSGAMINLMALGLSRTSAEAIADYMNDKDMSIGQLRSWLQELDVSKLDVSPICVREIESLTGSISDIATDD